MTRAVLAATARRGALTQMFGGAELQALPHFAPESCARTKGQIELVEAVRAADGIVIASPGYHGGVSGLVKNAIDLLEDLRHDRRSYLDGRAVGLIVVAAGWQACGTTLSAMRAIVHAMRGWPTPLGITANVAAQSPFDDTGAINDATMSRLIELQAIQLVGFAELASQFSQPSME